MASTVFDKLNFATRAAYVRDELDRLTTLASDLQTRLTQLQNEVKRWEMEARHD